MESLETIAVVLLISATVWPLVAVALRGYGAFVRTLGMAIVFLSIGVAFSASNLQRPEVQTEADVRDRPIQSPDDGYVTSDTCRSCHPKYHATWDASFHSKMTQIASPESVVGDFDNVQLRRGPVDFLLSEKDGRYFVSMRRAQPTGSLSASDNGGWSERNEIVMTTGSHHRQWVWYETGKTRKVHPLPFIYLIEQQRWIPKEAGFLVPPGRKLGMTTGEWNRNCIQCHSTQGRRLEDGVGNDSKMDTRVGEFGIACESCHGPAEEHIHANRNPARRYGLRTGDGHDPTIVNPANLEAELSSHVCGQCHSAMSLFKSRDKETYLTWNEEGFEYRPGQDLKDSRFLFGHTPHMEAPSIQGFLKANPDFLRDRFWSDGVIRIAGREFSGLITTPCYTHGDASKQMSCLSCHAMHRPEGDERLAEDWTDDQLKPEMAGNHACVQCHDDFSTDEQVTAHTHHEATSAASLCYNCHMPHTTFGLLKAIRSHGLVSPSVQSSLDTGRPNACNQCHLDQTLAWSADLLESWYGQPKPELSEDEQKIAASVLWSLKGDAGQRALMAWSMGWEEARAASGSDWMIPYLAELMKDPYDAVRFVANESLKAHIRDGYQAELEYDFLGPQADRDAVAERLRQEWVMRPSAKRDKPAVLFDENGKIQPREFQRLLNSRDYRPVSLME